MRISTAGRSCWGYFGAKAGISIKPGTPLDPYLEILPYFERLRDEALVPMIYVSHNPIEVRRIATRVVMLADGRVSAVGGADVLDAAQRNGERVNRP